MELSICNFDITHGTHGRRKAPCRLRAARSTRPSPAPRFPSGRAPGGPHNSCVVLILSAKRSQIECEVVAPPSEATTVRLAKELDEDSDVFLALAGKVSSDLQEIIRMRPRLFAHLIRELKEAPDEAVFRVVRVVRDGAW